MNERISVDQRDETLEITNEAAEGLAENQFDDLDDVEGHGLREIAAGVGTAAIVVGGAATFASQATHSAIVPPRPQVPSVVSQLASDTTTLTGHAVSGATGIADDAVAGAKSLVDPTLNQVASQVDSTLATAKGDVTATTQWARGVANYATTTVANTTGPAVQAADAITKNITHYAGQVAGDAVSLAGSAVGATTNLVGQQVKSIIGTTLQVTATAQSLVNNAGWTLGVSVLGDHVGTDGKVLSPTGVVSITDASGNAIASMHLADGKCTITLATSVIGGTLTMHYPGDALYGPSTLSISPLLG